MVTNLFELVRTQKYEPGVLPEHTDYCRLSISPSQLPDHGVNLSVQLTSTHAEKNGFAHILLSKEDLLRLIGALAGILLRGSPDSGAGTIPHR